MLDESFKTAASPSTTDSIVAPAASPVSLDGHGAFAARNQRGRSLRAPRALRHLFRHFARFAGVQREIVRLTLDGMTAKECAAALRVGVRTIETHWERIFLKTGARSKVELIGSLVRRPIR